MVIEPTGVPAFRVPRPDGATIAVFASGTSGARPLLLVHGAAGDHQTWRVVAPMLAAHRRVLAMDRRGHGDSGDAPGWSIELELADVAAVAAVVADASGTPVDVVGHSLGGRIALAVSRLTPSIGRVVAYEGAPPAGRPSSDLSDRLRALLAAGDLDALLAAFMTEAVGMPAAELAAFRANPIWARRIATGPTIVRELEAVEASPAIGMDALAAVTVRVLQLVGSASPPWFLRGAEALDARLAHGRIEVIDGARHGAHHSHAAEFTARVEGFLDD
jgi:pimeloyl-ACP methyl ester carboxylesterase